MAGGTKYPGLDTVTDPAIKRVLKLIFDKFGKLDVDLPAIKQSIVDLPIPTDVVDQTTLRKYVEGALYIHDNPIPVPTYAGATGGGGGPSFPGVPFGPPQEGSGNVRIGSALSFHTSGGLWPWRGSTDFPLYRMFLEGGAGAVAPILNNRAASGANLCRVFGAWPNAGFHPINYPNYYTQLAPFAALLDSVGLYLEFTCFAGDIITPFQGLESQADQTEFLTAVQEALMASPNVFIELGNENKGYDVHNFTRPPGILSSLGTIDLVTQPWDYCVIHPPRDDEWPRKAKDLMELRDGFGSFPGWQRPTVADEPMGCADVSIPGSRSNVPDDFYWFAATAQMMGAGATFHSQNGIDGQTWSGPQQACADSFYQAMAAVPIEAQYWNYTRGPLADCPIQHDDAWALRTFAKFTDHDAVVVVIRANGAWPGPIVQNGWSVVSSTGPVVSGSGTLIFLTR